MNERIFDNKTRTADCHRNRPVQARGLCGPCYSRQWRLAHLERARWFVRRYAAAHRDERLAYFKARRAAKGRGIRDHDDPPKEAA